MVIVIVVKDDDPVQLRMEDIYDHSFVSTIQHHISNNVTVQTLQYRLYT
jgi:DNA-directed RNA polymerase subunit L